MEEITVYPSPTVAEFVPSQSEELTIHIPASYHHPSRMSAEAKARARAEAPSLADLFEQTLQKKGAQQLSGAHWLNDQEVEIPALSHGTLHSFILKAEELGKTITYQKKLTVTISD